MLDVCLLGTGGMMPTANRYLASLIIRLNGKCLLIDTGEGTQVALRNVKWSFKAIDVICFTHFHADHISGLPGLLLTIGNSDRTEPLTLVGPKNLIHTVEGLRRICPELPFEINFIEIDSDFGEISVAGFDLSYLKVEHTITCYAYKIDVSRAGAFDVKKALANDVPREFWSSLQKGLTETLNGKTYIPSMVLGEDRKGIKLSYCTDSRPVSSLADFVYESDLFVCEGMYGDDLKLEKALENNHMLFSEAATLAKLGDVCELWLTHYSPSMKEPEEFIQVATDIFENTMLGYDGMLKTICFKNEIGV